MADIDLAKFKIKEKVVLKKFDGDWTEEQIAAGEADDALAETITLEDGVVIDHWRRDVGSGD